MAGMARVWARGAELRAGTHGAVRDILKGRPCSRRAEQENSLQKEVSHPKHDPQQHHGHHHGHSEAPCWGYLRGAGGAAGDLPAPPRALPAWGTQHPFLPHPRPPAQGLVPVALVGMTLWGPKRATTLEASSQPPLLPLPQGAQARCQGLPTARRLTLSPPRAWPCWSSSAC